MSKTSPQNESPMSDSDNQNDEYLEKTGKQRGRKSRQGGGSVQAPQSTDSFSAREQKKIDQYARLFQQQDQAELKKRKKVKLDDAQTVNQGEQNESPKNGIFPLEPIEAIPEKLFSAQVISNAPLERQQNDNSPSFRLNLNPRLKMKVLQFCQNKLQEKNQLFLFLSECQDKCQQSRSNLASTAPQLYSPPRNHHRSDHSNLYAMNQDILQETQYFTTYLVQKFKNHGDPVKHIGSDQREFISKYIEKKYLRNILKDSKMQIYKRGAEKNSTTQSFNKLIPKKY